MRNPRLVPITRSLHITLGIQLTVVRQMSRTPSSSYTPPVKRRSSVTAPPGDKQPRKCRRLSHTAQKFLDLEAYDAESEEDEDAADAELRDFLDDSPHFASRPHHSGHLLPLLPRSKTPTDEAQDALDIANAIRARERQRLLEAIPPSGMLDTTAAGSLVAARPAALIVPYMVSIPPIIVPYMISIPPNVPLEQKLIRWLRGSVPGVVDVMSHRLGSGRIYVTAQHYACLQRGLEEWPLSWNLSHTQRKPKPLPPLEYQLAMERLHERHAGTETPPERRPGTWARFTIDIVNGDDFMTLAGDLLVLLGQGLALTVPRINYTSVPVAPVLVPPCLSFPMTLIQAHPHMKDEIVLHPLRQCWTWRKRCFRESGLEVFQVDESEITVDGVEPTDDERRLFALSGDPLLCRPSLEPVVSALQPGDRVVVHNPGSPKSDGFIMRIFTGDDRTAMATVAPQDDPNPEHATERPKNLCVPLNRLRLHLLSTPRKIARGDRVLVVDGPHMETYGHVSEVSGLLALSIEPVDPQSAIITVEMRHVRVCFRLGDVVEVTRGELRGVTGFIVGMYHGGYVDIYVVSIARISRSYHSTLASHSAALLAFSRAATAMSHSGESKPSTLGLYQRRWRQARQHRS